MFCVATGLLYPSVLAKGRLPAKRASVDRGHFSDFLRASVSPVARRLSRRARDLPGRADHGHRQDRDRRSDALRTQRQPPRLRLPVSSDAGRVLRVALLRRTVSDLGRAIDFYCGALGFARDLAPSNGAASTDPAADGAPSRTQRLVLGAETIELTAPVGFERHPGGDSSGESVSNVAFQHFAVVTADMDATVASLRRFSPQAISRGGPVRLPAMAGGVTAYKFRDPDGHPLELIWFPDGVGDPKWQRKRARNGAATLGIDHSALAVADAEASRNFYVRGLGLEVFSRQINRGEAQSRLDGSEVVVVDVIGLGPAPAPTPHIELLAYRHPPPQGRRDASSIREDHGDRLTLIVDELAATLDRLDREVTPPTERDHLPGGAVLLRDPDGHLLLLQPGPA